MAKWHPKTIWTFFIIYFDSFDSSSPTPWMRDCKAHFVINDSLEPTNSRLCKMSNQLVRSIIIKYMSFKIQEKSVESTTLVRGALWCFYFSISRNMFATANGLSHHFRFQAFIWYKSPLFSLRRNRMCYYNITGDDISLIPHVSVRFI